MKKFLKYTFLYTASLFLALSYFNTDKSFEELAGQAQEDQILPDYLQIYGPFGFYMNVDSHQLLDATRNPENLLEENFTRQQRPVLILASAFLSRLIEPVNDLGIKYFGGRSASKEGNYNNGYAALLSYVILNFFILWLCFYTNYLNVENIFKKSKFKNAIFCATSSFVLFNGITKMYLISPHFQLFNILSPILMVYVLSMEKRNLLNAKKLGALFLMLGFGFLAYKIFVLPIILLFFRSLFWFFQSRNKFSNSILVLFICSGLSLMPFIFWNTYLYIQGVEFFDASLEFQKEFINDSGSFLINLLANTYTFLERFVVLALSSVMGSFSFPFVCFLGMLFFQRAQTNDFQNEFFSKQACMLILCFLLLPAFYSTSGLIVQRISDSAIYPLLLFLILLVLSLGREKSQQNIINSFFYVMALVNFAWIFLYFNLEAFIPISTMYLNG